MTLKQLGLQMFSEDAARKIRLNAAHDQLDAAFKERFLPDVENALETILKNISKNFNLENNATLKCTTNSTISEESGKVIFTITPKLLFPETTSLEEETNNTMLETIFTIVATDGDLLTFIC